MPALEQLVAARMGVSCIGSGNEARGGWFGFRLPNDSVYLSDGEQFPSSKERPSFGVEPSGLAFEDCKVYPRPLCRRRFAQVRLPIEFESSVLLVILIPNFSS